VKRLLLVVPAAALLLAGCSHPAHAGAAATVGDDRITTNTVRDMVNRGLAAVPATATKPDAAALGRQDLTQLIQVAVLKRVADSMNLTVTDQDIDAALSTAAGSGDRASLEQNAAAQGVDATTLRTYAAVVAYEQKIAEAIPVDAATLNQAYQQNLSSFQEVHVAHILVASEDQAKSILAQVKADPTQFAALAKKYSTDTGSKDKGGDLGLQPRSTYVKEFGDAAWAGKDGTIIGPVKSQYGYHIIKVISHKTISLQEATPQLKLSLQQVGQQLLTKYKDALAHASISVSPRYGKWDPNSGDSGLGEVVASSGDDLSSPVATPPAKTSTSPSASASGAPTG
jgi:foldase protein PrsA